MILEALLAYIIPMVFGFAIYLNLVESRSTWEGIATAWGLGWGAVYLIVFVPNQFFDITLTRAFLVTAAAGLLLTSAVLLWRKRTLLKIPSPEMQITKRKETLFVFAILAPLGVLIFYKASLILGGFDELVYHAYIPQLIYQSGSIPTEVNSLWSNLFNSYPNLFILQQSWIYFITGSSNDVTVRLLPAVYSVLTIGLVYSIATRLYSERAGLYAMIVFASVPIFVFMSVRFISDMPLAFFALLALNYVSRWEHEKSEEGSAARNYLVLIGVVLGLVTLVKYNGLVLALVVMGYLFYRARARAVIPLAFLLLVASPFYLRNLIVYGNPIFPYFNVLFNGLEIQMITLHEVEYAFGNSIGMTLTALLTLPVILSVIYLVNLKNDRRSLTFILIPILTFLFVFILLPAPIAFNRYVFFIYPILSIPAGRSLEWMVYEVLPEVVQRFRASLDVNRYAPAAVLIICALLIAPAYVHASEIKYDIYNDGEFRSASSDGILRNQGEYLKVGQWMDSNLRDDSKVLSFEVRRYYIETELVPADSDVVFDTYGTDLEGALRHVQSLGVTHVLDVPKYHDIVMTAPLYDKSPVFQNLDQESFVKIYSWGGAVLYEIDYDMAFGSVIDSGSEETEKQEWLDIRRYLDVEEGTVSALTNSNTTIEMVEAGTTVAISPQKGGAK
ncbi:MAG: ArnT family glycosyltransferase, partial [Planctomycetota bacterium]